MASKKALTAILICRVSVVCCVERKENRYKMLGVRGDISLQLHQPVI
jgi:hypothetical protein